MKSCLLIALFVTISACSFAQEKHLQFGIKGGIGVSGISKTEKRDAEVTDKFSKRQTYSAGLRVGYHFLKHFALVADPEWQMLEDHRFRTVTFYAQNVGVIVNSIHYRNRFQQVQIPISLQISPLTKSFRPYVSAGVQPSFIVGGNGLERLRTSAQPGETFEKTWKADFDIPANEKYKSAVNVIAGIGVGMGKYLSVEVTRTFAHRMNYSLFDPGFTKIGVPVLPNYALRNTRFSLIVNLR